MNAADGLRKPRPDTFVESVEGGVAMSEKQRSAGTVLGAVALLIVTGCDDGIGPGGSANLARGASGPFNDSGFYDIPPDEFNRVTGMRFSRTTSCSATTPPTTVDWSISWFFPMDRFS
jgi:hypothetical protein